jgi:hypothetical protein
MMKSIIQPAILISLSFLLIFGCNREEETPNYVFDDVSITITPSNNSTNIGVNSCISVKFSKRTDISYIKEGIYYSLIVDYINFYQNDVMVTHTTSWNDVADSIVLTPNSPLLPNSTVTIEVQSHWEVKSNNNLIRPENSLDFFNISTFETEKVSTEKIEQANVEYSYPFNKQYHFLQGEYDKGFIKLILPQNELFENAKTEEISPFKVNITNNTGYSYESVATYNSIKQTVNYSMPSDLDNESIYRLQILNSNKANSNNIYEIYFRTSAYNTFEEKMATVGDTVPLRYYVYPTVHYLYGYYSDIPECFDEFEMIPLIGLIRFELDPSTPYYKRFHYPLFYENMDKYEVGFSRKNMLDAETISKLFAYSYINDYNIDLDKNIPIPPLNAFCILQDITNNRLTPEQIEADNAPRIESLLVQFKCFYNYIANKDYYIAKQHVASKYYNVSVVPDWASEFLNNSFSAFSAGDYTINISYTLPNGVTTSTKTITWTLNIGLDIEKIALD